ncbi:gig suppressor [Hypoxylon texense]
MADTPRYAGGFLPDGRVSLPSPAPSAASSRAAANLPHPRSKPLVRGSKKEDFARNYISDRLMHISRRYVKKHGIPDPADEVTGYESMDEVCKDIEEVVDVLWFTSTPSLQIPYLLNVALAFNTYLPAFPPSPHPTFALLKKLDHCFSSLIMGRDIKTGNPLPGFETRGYATTGFSRTDMVRCKSIADETRMLVAMVMSDEPDVEPYAYGDDDDYARPPARRNVSVSLSTGFIQSPVDDSIYSHDESDSKIKTEADDLHFEDSDGESVQSATTKRKSDDTDHEDDAHEDSKRIKVEQDDEDVGPTFSDAAPGNASPNPFEDEPGPRPSGQFHFMGDDDSDDDEVASLLNSTAYTATTAAATVATTLSAAQREPDTEQDMGEPIEDVDEEEEELQLNVGEVYMKTLLELGKSLGESIAADY